MNRTEYFSVAVDDETSTNELTCRGQIKLTVRNTDTYRTVQREFFNLDDEFSFIYISEPELTNNNVLELTTINNNQ